MWLIGLGVVLLLLAISIAPKEKQELVAQPKESEKIEPDICDELNELEAKILKFPNGMSVPDYPPNQEIFARQTQIMNDYYRMGIDINMDIKTGQWKIM